MSQASAKLLLIDDDEAFLRVLGRALKRRGYEVITAQNTETALALASDERPLYAVVDLKLGAESGLDLVPQLKAIRQDMVVVVLTGYASIATTVTAIKRGASNYLTKPVTADDVVLSLTEGEDLDGALEDYTPMSVERLEWEHIQKVLQEHDGNISATARSLGMYRRTLQRKLAKKPVPGQRYSFPRNHGRSCTRCACEGAKTQPSYSAAVLNQHSRSALSPGLFKTIL